MRIIAGSLKGRRLATPEPGALDIRPTADRAREALFSILQGWPKGGFLDLYAGTGAVALEAWSRGYAPVTAVDQAPTSLALLKKNATGTTLDVRKQDALRLTPEAFRDLAVVFCDPPYAQAAEAWSHLARVAGSWLKPGGVLVLETDRHSELPEVAGWTRLDQRRYGLATFHFLVPEQL